MFNSQARLIFHFEVLPVQTTNKFSSDYAEQKGLFALLTAIITFL